jgi:hypothetical protein
MQFKKIIFTFLISVVIFSCKKEVAGNGANSTFSSTDVNNWIYQSMNTYYLWSTKMPTIAKTNLTIDPMNYFTSILYDYGNTDRFSWIDSSSSNLINQLNGVNKVLGIKINSFFVDNTKPNGDIAMVIAYVIKGSPAEKAGIKRGDIILTVDDQTVNAKNYNTILQNSTLKLGFGNFVNNTFSNNGKFLTVTKVELQTNPILMDTVINWSGKKVGYFSYTQFLNSYDDSLRAVFGRFKSKGVNELVVDLRYNGGGYVSSSDLLTNLIVKDLGSHVNNVMNKKTYNDAYTQTLTKQSSSNPFVTNFQNEANNLGNLSRVFILTSNNTASASELIINNLRPFMNVILVGEHTYGKNVGSFTITDDQNRWNYGLQPITFKIVNSLDQSDYGTVNGFTPNYQVVDNVLPYKLLGDPYETLFNSALNVIGAVAYQSNSTHPSQKIIRNLAQAAAISDNRNLDRHDMFDHPPHTRTK